MKRFHLLTALAMAAIVLAGCGDDSSSSTDATLGTSDTAAAPTGDGYGGPSDSTATTAAPADTAEATVAVADVGGVGEALVGPDGRTLYLFEQDSGTTSACTGACADAWPALVADGEPTGADGVDASLLATADGAEPNHVVYNGHLLYHFSGDAAPGDASGVGIPGWFPVDPAGEAIGEG